MGRHSRPDPQDSAGPDPADDRSDKKQTEHVDMDADPQGRPSAFDDGFESADQDFDADDHTDDFDSPDRTPVAALSPEPPRSAGPQHGGDWEGGEWTGSHRAVTPAPRGVSIGVIGP